MKPAMLFVVTSPFAVNVFLKGHFEVLAKQFDITVMTAVEDRLAKLTELECVRVVPLRIYRRPSPLNDLQALFAIWKELASGGYRVIMTITPKAGLLGMIAGFFARVPNRIHYFTGQVWATRTGLIRAILKAFDRLIALLATRVIADGHSQVAFLIEQKIVQRRHIQVIGPGPICGVDLDRFTRKMGDRVDIRKKLNIAEDATVALYLGRLNAEKGIAELTQAFRKIIIGRQSTRLILLFVGPVDDDRVSRNLAAQELDVRASTRMCGGVSDPERYMAAADFLVLPSYREGFPMVVLEAAAMELPAIVTDIYGFSDAVEENVTAIKIPVRDADQLAAAMLRLCNDEGLRKQMGLAAAVRVRDKYSAASVTKAWIDFFQPLAKA